MSDARNNPEIVERMKIEQIQDASLVIPTQALSKTQVEVYSKHVRDSLLAKHSAVETLVIAKQLELLTKALLSDDLKDSAINSMKEKVCEVMGAEVSTRRSVEYEYSHNSLTVALGIEKTAKENVKNIKTQLEFGKEKGWIDPQTGEIGFAKLIKDGIKIAVTFKK